MVKTGIELEYWTVDGQGRLTSCEKIVEKHGFAEQEFVKPLLEIKTEPHQTFQELKKETVWKLKKLVETARTEDLKIVPLGTPLNSGKIQATESPRGKIQQQIIGENLEAAKRVAGTHIHFEKADVKKQLNTLTALDPALAVTNSSPYYQGEKLASSSRNQVYRYKCYKDFPGHGQLWNYTESVQEWEQRIQQRFKEFTEAGKEAGVPEPQIEKHFLPENALWNPVRLRDDFPTVEWRAPDTCFPVQTLEMIENVKHVMENPQELPPMEKVRSTSEKAIAHGIKKPEVRIYLEKMGMDLEKFTDTSKKFETGESITRSQARRLRLEAAGRMEREINEIS